jgi:putative peptide zinc metalloprotease protein
MRRLIPILIAFSALLIAMPVGASAEGGGANHVVLARATADGLSHERSGLQVAHAGGPTVASTNLAAAISYACTGCRTVAIAFQAVLVTGDPHTVVPVNAGVATNVACTGCTAYAFAYQYVLSTGGPVHLSPEGQQTIGDLREQIRGLAESGLPPAELTTALNAVKDRFKATIDDELIAAGKPVNGAETTQLEAAPAPTSG